MELVEQVSDDGWTYVFNCHFNTAFADSNLYITEECDKLAEFNIDSGNCYCTLERMKKKARDGSVLFEASQSTIYSISFYRVPEPMMLNLFMPLLVILTLQYFIFFS